MGISCPPFGVPTKRGADKAHSSGHFDRLNDHTNVGCLTIHVSQIINY